MKRIILLVFRLIFRVPGYLWKLHKYGKDPEKYNVQERYDFVRGITKGIIDKGNVHLEVYGKENIPEKNGYLIVPNHQGLFDPVAIIYDTPTPLRAIVKKELMDTIAVNDAIRTLEFIPMDRSDVRGSVKLILEATKYVKSGGNFLIFAEGTRSKKGNTLGEMKGGSMKIAVKAKAPILPVAFIDSFKVFDENTAKQITVQMHYLKPITPEEYDGMNTNEIAALVQSRIEECIAANIKQGD